MLYCCACSQGSTCCTAQTLVCKTPSHLLQCLLNTIDAMGIFRSLTKLTHLSKSHKPISSFLNPTLSLSKTNPFSPTLSPLHPSHSATPFFFQSDVIFLPSFQALASPIFSRVNFGVRRVGSGEENVGGGDPVGKGGGRGGVDGFLNLPNLISMSRLISGPVIGWYALDSLVIYSLYFSFWG